MTEIIKEIIKEALEGKLDVKHLKHVRGGYRGISNIVH